MDPVTAGALTISFVGIWYSITEAAKRVGKNFRRIFLHG